MGSLYKYECESCSYHAQVCGGYDRGFEARLVTISCSQCQEVLDISIEQEQWATGVELELAKKPDPNLFTCKTCGKDSCPKFTEECPRCGSSMRRTHFIMDWD